MKKLALLLTILSLSAPAFAQNSDLKRAIKHYQSQNFGLAEKEINEALNESFESDQEVAEAMYYYYLIHMKIYGSASVLKENVHITEKIAESYTIYTSKDSLHTAEMEDGLIQLSHELVTVAEKQYVSKDYSGYFYTMDHIGLILETIGESTGDYIEKLAEDATRLGMQKRANSYWHQMIEKNYKSEFAYKELLSMLYNLKKYDQVDELLKQAKADFPSSLSFSEVEILRYVDRNMKYTALNLAKKVVASEPNNLDVMYLYGLLSAQHNEHDEALSSFIHVAHMKTDHFETNRELGKYYYRFSQEEGHMDLAMKYLEKAHSLQPEDSVTKDLLHHVYLESGFEGKAMSLN